MSAEIEVNQGLLDATIEIGKRRADTLRRVRELLTNDRDSEAVKLLRKHFGIEKPRVLRFPHSKKK